MISVRLASPALTLVYGGTVGGLVVKGGSHRKGPGSCSPSHRYPQVNQSSSTWSNFAAHDNPSISPPLPTSDTTYLTISSLDSPVRYNFCYLSLSLIDAAPQPITTSSISTSLLAAYSYRSPLCNPKDSPPLDPSIIPTGQGHISLRVCVQCILWTRETGSIPISAPRSLDLNFISAMPCTALPTPPASPTPQQQSQKTFPSATPTPESRIGTFLGQSLELTGILGTGAYGVVYSAIDHFTQTWYAVKALSKTNANGEPLDRRQREFQSREIQLHYKASAHPNIVSMLKIMHDPQCTYVILDYCPEGDLFSNITERGRYVNNDALVRRAFLQLLDAVEHCHRLGIFHRDLKPENILVSNNGNDVKLADFGLATEDPISEDHGCGSTFYMSPGRPSCFLPPPATH